MAQQCFFYRSDTDKVTAFQPKHKVYPCPSGIGCCNEGSTCLSNGICQYPSETNIRPGYSGFFRGSCSDSTFPSDCPRDCTALPNPDIVFDQEQQAWFCCGWDAQLNRSMCDHHTKQSFSAPAPSDLKVLGVALIGNTIVPSTLTSPVSSQARATAVSTTDASTVTNSNMSTTSTQPSNQSQAALNTGAAVGIAASVTLVSVAMVAAIAYLILRHRLNLQVNKTRNILGQTNEMDSISNQLYEIGERANRRYEADSITVGHQGDNGYAVNISHRRELYPD